jgi:hypothetical protein
MAKLTVTISEELAQLVRERQTRAGLSTPDAAAAAMIAEGALAQRLEEDDFSDDELRRLIDEADASGPTETWDAKAMRDEARRGFAESGKKK